MPQLLAVGGVAVIEIGHTQAAAVLDIAAAAGLGGIIVQDLGARDRCLVLSYSAMALAAA